MKTYEKPTFTLVSLSANTAFCNSCYYDAFGPDVDPIIKDIIDKDPNAFEAGTEGCSTPVVGYCKFLFTEKITFTS